jgi:hypothetical protein
VDLGPLDGPSPGPRELFADRAYDAPSRRLTGLELGPYGYRWIKL